MLPLDLVSPTHPRLTWWNPGLEFALALAPGLAALWAPSVGEEMSALSARIDPATPYWTGAAFGLTYLRMPLAVFGALWLVLAPGRSLARAFDLGESFAARLPYALALSLAALVPAGIALQFGLGVRLEGGAFVLFAMAIGAVCELVRLLRARAGSPGPAHAEAATMFAVAMAFVVALTPKFFFENFNGDGAHAFESSRLLLHEAVPFWPASAGELASFPGLNSTLFTYPNAWFLRLFGPIEAAIRLPFMLYLLALYGCVVALCEHGAPRRLTNSAKWLIAAGIASFALIQAYSATYDPYCSDIGLPATQDSLTMVVFFGMALASLQRRLAWMFAFVLLTLASSPNGILLIGLWIFGMALSSRTHGWRPSLTHASVVVAALAVFVVVPQLLTALSLPVPGGEHSSTNLLDKFRQLQVWDPQRFVFLIVPAGIYPAIGLIHWRTADAANRAWIVVTLGVFGLFYALAFVSLHYFVPVMLTPLIVFWRGRLFTKREPEALVSRTALGACTVCAVASVALATPQQGSISTSGRTIGETISIVGFDGYEHSEPGAFRASDLLATLFTPGWNPAVPDEAYAGSAHTWHYYAMRAGEPKAEPVYELRAREIDASVGEPVAENDAARLYVLDPAAHAVQRTLKPAGSLGRSLYMIPRAVLFGRKEAALRPGVFTMGSRPGRR